MSERVSEKVSEKVSERVSEKVSEKVSEWASEYTIEWVSVCFCVGHCDLLSLQVDFLKNIKLQFIENFVPT